jgi:GcrA cell cycle regulator
MIPWTTQETFLLIGLWPKASATQISRWLNRSRSSICGKIMRLRHDDLLPGGVEKHFEVKPRPDRHVRPPRTTAEPTIRPQKPTAPNLGLLQMRPCSLLELDDGRCHWPLGEMHEVATLFCGGAIVPGRRYCAHHLRMAH